MKITKQYLTQLIKEELNNFFKENSENMKEALDPGLYPGTPPPQDVEDRLYNEASMIRAHINELWRSLGSRQGLRPSASQAEGTLDSIEILNKRLKKVKSFLEFLNSETDEKAIKDKLEEIELYFNPKNLDFY